MPNPAASQPFYTPFFLYVPPFLSLSGPLRFGLLPFLKGRVDVEREGETTSTDLGICEQVEGGQQEHPALGVVVG